MASLIGGLVGGLGGKCVSNAAYIAAAGTQAAAIVAQAVTDAAIATALALYQRRSSSSISDMQNEVASSQMALAEAVQEHAAKFWPAEQQLVEDTFGLERAKADYEGLPAQWKELVSSSMETGREAWLKESRRICQSPSWCEDARWQRSNRIAQADALSFAARQTEGRTETINDRRYEQQYGVLQMGKGRLSTISGYQAVGLTAGGNTAGMLLGTINSALEAYGYYSGAQQPPQWGQAAGIRAKWGLPYQPEPPAPQPISISVQSPAAPAPAAAPAAEGGKMTEMSEGLKIYEDAREQGLFN